ncbi:MAG: 30S ribosomal protein S17e [Nanoarchaeota archaeon]
MGKIKSKLIRRSANELIRKGVVFTEHFEENKKVLGNFLPSKKIRNQIAGLLGKIVKRNKLHELELQKALK